MIKDYNKMYGFCLGCEKYVPRDDMISTNFIVYGEGIAEKHEKIRFRLCPRCHNKQMRRWKTSWNNKYIVWNGKGNLKRACEIMIDERLADRCDDIDFDDQDQNAVFETVKNRR